MKIEIKNRYTESVLFSHDVEENTLKISLLAALKAGANLRGANLRGANLVGVNLAGANLRGANLDGVNLVGANLRGANLAGVNLAGSNLRGVNLAGANLDGVNLDGANLYRANLAGVNLDGSNLDGVNLDGVNLDGADLYGVNLRGANLDGEKILQNPIKMVGHQYWILITDSFMRIGCQRHTHQQWAEFDSKQIDDMGSHATEFWNQWKAPLLAMCAVHSGKVKKWNPQNFTYYTQLLATFKKYIAQQLTRSRK